MKVGEMMSKTEDRPLGYWLAAVSLPEPASIEANGLKHVRSTDGRIVEYSVIGSKQQDTRVLVSGYSASIDPPWRETLEKLNILEITVSLPGLGMSTIQPGRKIADWPKTDLEPVLQAEKITGKFTVCGSSYGCLTALSVAQYYGPERVLAMGLRVPYLPLPLSKELNLPNGQPTLPTTEQINAGTWTAWMWKFLFSKIKLMLTPWSCTQAIKRMLGTADQRLRDEYPDEVKYLNEMMMRTLLNGHYKELAMLYMMASDVALDCPDLDVRSVRLSGDQVVVWYGKDDEDCPPSHGQWLAEHFKAKTRVINGFGHAGAAMIENDKFIEELLGGE